MHGRRQYRVEESEIARFEADGALALRALVDDAWLGRLRVAIDRNMEADDWYFHYIYMWQRDEVLRDFCFNSPLGEVASQLLRTDKVHLIYDQVFVKDARRTERTEWHNDQPYWPVRGPTCSIWLSIDQTDEAAGAMEFIRGSHRWRPVVRDRRPQPARGSEPPLREDPGLRCRARPARDPELEPPPG